MIDLPVTLFLNVFDDGLCVSSENDSGRAMVDINSEEYAFAHRDLNRVIYTITLARSDFPNVKEKSILTIKGIGYKVVKPPIVEDDAFILICTKE